ncbi:MAG: heparinase II/III family protein [Clostridia bacterium]|nr:heparinase II/III family protein [Clostridia bacterium]
MKISGTLFTKPYADSLFGVQNQCHYTYPREILIKEKIFPYLVLDGGASQLAYDRFGGIDGDHLLELTMSGKLFDEFRKDGVFNWETSFAYTKGTEFRPKYEWQIWPQRLYMTVPVAHAFLKSGEEKYAKAWLTIVKEWDKAHPYQPFDPNIHYLKTDMVWRDMQVAWRTMSLLHGVFMLEDAPFTKEDWSYLYSFIELHVNHLYEEALDRIARNHTQNHVLQIGVVLIMAAAMFPEFKNAGEVLKIGIDTVRMNMQAIYPDGGSNEDSPSYSHFISRLYLEAYLLLRNNKLGEIDGLYESIVKQYEWMYHMSSPKGETLQISDSYVMDTLADLRRARELVPIEFNEERRSILLSPSGVAVLKKGDMTLYVDAMPLNRGHQHMGRPQIILYRGNNPIIIDAGCCSYDRWELYLSLRLSKMHNVIYSPEIDYERCDYNHFIDSFDPKGGRISFVGNIEWEGKKYTWTRKMTLTEDKFIIEDEVNASEPMKLVSNLFLPRGDINVKDTRCVEALTHHYLLSINSQMDISTELCPTMGNDNKIDYSIRLSSEDYTQAFRNTTILNTTATRSYSTKGQR